MSRDSRLFTATGRQVVIAVNPTAGASETAKAAEELKSALETLGYIARTESSIQEIRRLAGEMGEDLRCVVAAGGDGTIALLANELPARTTLALLPQGTENLLAKYLGVPWAAAEAAAVMHRGLGARLDAGEANRQLFLVMSSCGFDARVVHQVHKARKGHIRHWAYAKPIVDSIRKYRYPTLNIHLDDDPEPVRVKWAFVFNAPRYAMGLPIAEEADAMDGLLDLCGFRGGNLVNGLLYLTGIVLRQHRSWQDTTLRQARRIRIEADEPVPYQIDGDPGGHLPVEIRVVPQRLSILVPESWAHRYRLAPGDESAHQNPREEPLT